MTTFNLYANNYSRAYVNTYFDYLPKEIIDIIHEYNAGHRPDYTHNNRYKYFINNDISEVDSVRILLRESNLENRNLSRSCFYNNALL
jgi:hypothetical protein